MAVKFAVKFADDLCDLGCSKDIGRVVYAHCLPGWRNFLTKL